jgi:predicted Zn-ribbon and HTH transcriptional regulator
MFIRDGIVFLSVKTMKPLLCPKCGADWRDVEVKTEDIKWIPSGRFVQLGSLPNKVQAFDPVAQKATCKRCGTTFSCISRIPEKEAIEFT